LIRLTQLLFEFLTESLSRDPKDVANVLWRDYSRGARREVPEFLRPFVAAPSRRERLSIPTALPARQARHLQAAVHQKDLPEDASRPRADQVDVANVAVGGSPPSSSP